MNWLFDQSVLAVLGVLFGFLGIIVSIIVTMRSRIRVEPFLFYENIREVSKLSDANRKIIVRYSDQEVNQVTTTRVWLWNKGKRPLRREDVPAKDQLLIELKKPNDAENKIAILDFAVLKRSKESSNFQLHRTESANTLLMDFDYLDCRDGVLMDIQHTGDDKTSLSLAGVILGPKRKTKILVSYDTLIFPFISPQKKISISKQIMILAVAFGIPILLILIMSHFIPSEVGSRVELFETEFPEFLLAHGVDSTKALTITQGVITKYERKEPILFILGVVETILLILMLTLYVPAYRRKYPKTLKPD